ncbi:MAG: gluconate 2-dehydrogenase subunit 3 family protein [Gemmatimonadaceae bacterium]
MKEDGASDVEDRGSGIEPVSRREALGRLALASLVAAIDFTPHEVDRALRSLDDATRGTQYKPKFFTAHEWATVGILVNLIIPRDDRSGSAGDAGVPQFLDFMMSDGNDSRRHAMRGGLAWLDRKARSRFTGRDFRRLTATQQRSILDEIAWPKRAKPEDSHGVAFFNSFRDLTASGFWSSRMGVRDLGYQGNAILAQWTGCPPAVLAKLGLSE